jgi:hypothetical protein
MEISYVFCIPLLHMNVQLHIFVWILISFGPTVYIHNVAVQRNLWPKFRNNFSIEGGKDRQSTTDFLRDVNFISFATTCFGLCRPSSGQ